MSNEASNRLERLSKQIMKIWEERAIKEIEAAHAGNTLELQDDLPNFIERLVLALSTLQDRSSARKRIEEEKENTRVEKKHGHDRAISSEYTIDQVISEYHILRQVICDVMEEEAPLSEIEREVIVCAVEQAVNVTATQFSKDHHEIQQRYTNALAHDLRGPITIAKMNAEIVLKQITEEIPKSLIKKIISAMERLDFIIHDLLDASKLREGEKLNLVLSDFDLNNTINQVAAEMNPIFDNRIKLKSVGQVNGHWDTNALRRVIDNLVTNALKFSPPKTPVTIELNKENQNVELSIHNLGKGLSADEKASLFQPFKRVKNAEGKEGWGLGLSVVRGITDAHEGTIEVDSSEQDGTSFKVILPIAGPKEIHP